MAEYDDDDEQGGSKNWRALERKAADAEKRLKDAEERAAKAERRIAFIDAGIDTTNGIGKLIAKSYDGDLDAEAIRAFASDHGYDAASAADDGSLGASAPRLTEEQQQRAESQGRIDAMRGVSTGGSRVGWDDFKKLMESDPKKGAQLYEQGLVDRPDVAVAFQPTP